MFPTRSGLSVEADVEGNHGKKVIVFPPAIAALKTTIVVAGGVWYLLLNAPV
jgi:hypothetical protein